MTIWFAFALAIAVQPHSGLAQSGQNVSVPFPGDSEGNTFSTIPFTAGPQTSLRFQQLYDFAGDDIAGIQGPFLIRSISFREDATHQFGFTSYFADFQLNLSTTSRSDDGLSTVFSENVGADDRVVIPRGEFRIGASQVIIRLATPFLFDPREGNLLLDIRNYGGGGTGWGIPPFAGPAYLDALSALEDGVSSVSATSINALSGSTSTLGLVTTFHMTQVPEPSSLVVAAFSGLLAVGIRTIFIRGRK